MCNFTSYDPFFLHHIQIIFIIGHKINHANYQYIIYCKIWNDYIVFQKKYFHSSLFISLSVFVPFIILSVKFYSATFRSSLILIFNYFDFMRKMNLNWH